MKSTTKVLAIGAKAAASLGLLWLALRGIDFGAVWTALGNVEARWLIVAPLALTFGALVSGVRWHVLLRAHAVPVPLRRATALVLISNFFNSGLPSTFGGDAARIYYATKGAGAKAGAVLPAVTATILLDRFAGLACVMLVTVAVTLLAPYGLEFTPLWRTASLALGLGVAGGFVFLALINVVPRPASWTARAAGGSGWTAAIVDTLAAIAALRVSVAATGVATVVSIPVVVSVGVALAALSAATGPEGALGLGRAVAIAGPLVLATSVPISFAGWGVREVLLVQLFPLLGLPAEAGLITSVLFGLSVFVAGTPGLVAWLLLQRPDESEQPRAA